MHPLVSVCIPAYNHERFISESLLSVLGQSLRDFEVIVVDDASKDGTLAAARAHRDPRVAVHRNERNMGPSFTLNAGMRRARGRYIALLASDDAFLPGKLEEQVAYMDRNPGTLAVFGFAEAVDELGNVLPADARPFPAIFRQANRSRAQWLRRFFFEGNCLCAPTVLFRREVMRDVGEHDVRLLQLQDLDYWVRICLRGDIHVLQRPLTRYRVHGASLSTKGDAADARVYWESHKVLRNFLAIGERAFFFDVFPEGPSMPASDTLPLPFMLGRIAASSHLPALQLFGLEVLFDLLGDERSREQLAAAGFRPSDFHRLVAESDPFHLRLLGRRADLLAEIRHRAGAKLARAGRRIGQAVRQTFGQRS